MHKLIDLICKLIIVFPSLNFAHKIFDQLRLGHWQLCYSLCNVVSTLFAALFSCFTLTFLSCFYGLNIRFYLWFLILFDFFCLNGLHILNDGIRLDFISSIIIFVSIAYE